MIIGCYTAPEGTGTGLVAPGRPAVATPSPSYLIQDQDRDVVYAVSEAREGSVSSFRRATLEPLSTVSTGGVWPCHLALHPDGYVLAANYGSGSVSVHPVTDGGVLGAYTDLVRHSGTGPHADRQQGPHTHQVVIAPDGLITVVDLGIDQLVHYRLEDGRLIPAGTIDVPAGTGPRHFVVHPSGRWFLVGELSSSVLSLSDGKVTETVPTTSFDGDNFPSAIALDGDLLYVANRGADTIAVFEVTPELRRIAEVPCGGEWPRDLVVADGRLHVANQNSGTVVTFTAGRTPEPTGEVLEVGSPACILL
jgi:6-phosphogluconolactonase